MVLVYLIEYAAVQHLNIDARVCHRAHHLEHHIHQA